MTASLTHSRHRYTYDEYLAFERDSKMKHEFVDGEIYAMAGGHSGTVPSHRGSALLSKVLALRIASLFSPTCDCACSPQGERPIRMPRMISGPIQLDPADPSGTTITNPSLLVEVLSPSTEEVDRGSKLEDYQRIPSLQEYVLVGQHPRVEIYRRLSSGSWEYRDVREGVVTLGSGATLDLSILYTDLPH
jgi:Uma2 family endonuclease